MSKMINKSLWSIGRFARTSRHRLPVVSSRRRAEPQPRVGGISGRGDGQRKGRTLAVAPPPRDVSWSMSGRGGGVVSSAGVPPLIGTAARRRRALAHLSPIFDLHLYRARNPSDVDWSAYDFIALVQLTVDTIAMSWGLDGNLGAPRTVVLSEMTRTAAAMAPQRPTDEHAHVAAHVLDHLLRHDEPTPYFAVDYADPDASWRTATSRCGCCTRRSQPTGRHCRSTSTIPPSRCCSSRPTVRWTRFRGHTLGSLTHGFLTAMLTVRDADTAVRSDTPRDARGPPWWWLRARILWLEVSR